MGAGLQHKIPDSSEILVSFFDPEIQNIQINNIFILYDLQFKFHLEYFS